MFYRVVPHTFIVLRFDVEHSTHINFIVGSYLFLYVFSRVSRNDFFFVHCNDSGLVPVTTLDS